MTYNRKKCLDYTEIGKMLDDRKKELNDKEIIKALPFLVFMFTVTIMIIIDYFTSV